MEAGEPSPPPTPPISNKNPKDDTPGDTPPAKRSGKQLWALVRQRLVATAVERVNAARKRIELIREAAIRLVREGRVIGEGTPDALVPAVPSSQLPITKQGDLTLYTQKAMGSRRALRHNQGLTSVMNQLWKQVCAERNGLMLLSKKNYVRFFTVARPVLVPAGHQQYVEWGRDPSQWVNGLCDEWLKDLGEAAPQVLPMGRSSRPGTPRRRFMDYPTFVDSLFELIDAWTATTEAEEYVALARRLLEETAAHFVRAGIDEEFDPNEACTGVSQYSASLGRRSFLVAGQPGYRNGDDDDLSSAARARLGSGQGHGADGSGGESRPPWRPTGVGVVPSLRGRVALGNTPDRRNYRLSDSYLAARLVNALETAEHLHKHPAAGRTPAPTMHTVYFSGPAPLLTGKFAAEARAKRAATTDALPTRRTQRSSSPPFARRRGSSSQAGADSRLPTPASSHRARLRLPKSPPSPWLVRGEPEDSSTPPSKRPASASRVPRRKLMGTWAMPVEPAGGQVPAASPIRDEGVRPEGDRPTSSLPASDSVIAMQGSLDTAGLASELTVNPVVFDTAWGWSQDGDAGVEWQEGDQSGVHSSQSSSVVTEDIMIATDDDTGSDFAVGSGGDSLRHVVPEDPATDAVLEPGPSAPSPRGSFDSSLLVGLGSFGSSAAASEAPEPPPGVPQPVQRFGFETGPLPPRFRRPASARHNQPLFCKSPTGVYQPIRADTTAQEVQAAVDAVRHDAGLRTRPHSAKLRDAWTATTATPSPTTRKQRPATAPRARLRASSSTPVLLAKSNTVALRRLVSPVADTTRRRPQSSRGRPRTSSGGGFMSPIARPQSAPRTRGAGVPAANLPATKRSPVKKKKRGVFQRPAGRWPPKSGQLALGSPGPVVHRVKLSAKHLTPSVQRVTHQGVTGRLNLLSASSSRA